MIPQKLIPQKYADAMETDKNRVPYRSEVVLSKPEHLSNLPDDQFHYELGTQMAALFFDVRRVIRIQRFKFAIWLLLTVFYSCVAVWIASVGSLWAIIDVVYVVVFAMYANGSINKLRRLNNLRDTNFPRRDNV